MDFSGGFVATGTMVPVYIDFCRALLPNVRQFWDLLQDPLHPTQLFASGQNARRHAAPENMKVSVAMLTQD
jgi:hypothetical protein